VHSTETTDFPRRNQWVGHHVRMEPISPQGEPVSRPEMPSHADPRWRVVNVFTMALISALATIGLWRDGFNWWSVITLILAAIALGLELFNLLRTRRRATRA
jgi:hypothetical protein